MNKSELEEKLKNCNQQQTADYFGVHLATIKRAIKKFNIAYDKKSGGHPDYRDNPLDPTMKLSEVQNNAIIGSLLGDGFLLKKTKIFRLKQKFTRKEYVQYMHNLLSPFTTPIRTDKTRKPSRVNGKVSHKLEHWKGGYCYVSSFSTRQHTIFDQLREKWYSNNTKIVPKDLVLNEEILTHWYLEDGNHNKQKNYYKFSTQSFTFEEVENLCNLINSKFNINSELQIWESKPIIMITKTKGEEVLHNIFQKTIGFHCFQYKI